MKLTVCFCPKPEKTDWLVCGSNPSASTLTAYGPGFNCGKLKRPAPSVLALRLEPVSMLTTVTRGIRNGRAARIGHRAHNGAGGLPLGQKARPKTGQHCQAEEQAEDPNRETNIRHG